MNGLSNKLFWYKWKIQKYEGDRYFVQKKKKKRIKYLNVKVRIIKLLEGNLGINPNDLKLSHDVLSRPSKAKATKDER